MKHNLTATEFELVRNHVASNNDVEPSKISDAKVRRYISDATDKEVKEFIASLHEEAFYRN